MSVETYKYQSDAGGIYKIRMDEDKFAQQGSEPAGAITDSNVEVIVSNAGRKRKFGISPRGAVFKRTVDAADGSKKAYYAFFPALSQANLATLIAASPITYKGNSWTYLDSVSEE